MKKIIVFMMLLPCLVVKAQLPNVTLRDIDGNKINLQEVGKEHKPVVISFFATWCKPCLRELNAINEVYQDWQEEVGVRVIAVSIDRAQDIEKVKPLADGNNWDFMVLLDSDNTLKRQMQVQTVPHLFIFDKNAKLIEQHTGYVDGEEERIIDLLRN